MQQPLYVLFFYSKFYKLIFRIFISTYVIFIQFLFGLFLVHLIFVRRLIL